MASYLVLGRGVGAAIAYHLGRQPDTHSVTIMDMDKSVLELGRLLKSGSNAHYDYLLEDITKCNLPGLFGMGFNVVISALPAKYNFDIAKAAVEAGVHFCDLGGVVDITRRQVKELGKLAKKKNVSIIPDCGLMPGLGIIMVRKLMYELPNSRQAEIYVGGLPQKPKPPIYYQKVFNIEGLASICYENAPILHKGKVKFVPPFSGYSQDLVIPELFDFWDDPNGTLLEGFITAGASIAPWTLKKMGLKEFAEWTVRWPGFAYFVHNIPRDKFVETITPHINTPVTSENPDLVWMRVQVAKPAQNAKEKKAYRLLDLFDDKTGLTAMERTTGFTTAIIAGMMAKYQAKPGVNTPETAFTKKNFMLLWKELEKTFNIRRD